MFGRCKRSYFAPLVVLLLVCAMGGVGCTERITLETDNLTPRLVVHSLLSNVPGTQTVELTRTVNYFGEVDSLALLVKGAQVWINDEPLTESPLIPGLFSTRPDFAAQPGEVYRLRVAVDFDSDGTVDNYESSMTMPLPIRLDDARIVVEKESVMGREQILFSFAFQIYWPRLTDIMARLYIDGMPHFTRLDRMVVAQGTSDDKETLWQPMGLFMLAGSSIRNVGPTDSTVWLSPWQTIDLSVGQITPEYARFLKGAQMETGGGNPIFSGPPSNVVSNISNGALGCFGGYAEERTQREMPYWDDFYVGKWGFDESKQNGKYTFVVDFQRDKAVVISPGSTNYQPGQTFADGITVNPVGRQLRMKRYDPAGQRTNETWFVLGYTKLSVIHVPKSRWTKL